MPSSACVRHLRTSDLRNWTEKRHNRERRALEAGDGQTRGEFESIVALKNHRKGEAIEEDAVADSTGRPPRVESAPALTVQVRRAERDALMERHEVSRRERAVIVICGAFVIATILWVVVTWWRSEGLL